MISPKEYLCERLRLAGEIVFRRKAQEAGIVQDVAEFAGRKADIQRKQNGACLEHSVIRFKQAMAIAAEESDAIAVLDAGLAQSAGKTADAVRQFARK